MSSTNSQKLHFVLIPLLAQGHMIPMIDMARLFAENGVKVSLVTTPHNASRFATIVNRSRESEGKEIELIQIPFPSEQVGLPPGCENLDSVPSRDLIRNFYTALNSLQKPVEFFLTEHDVPPSCIISDKCLSWTSQTARKFNVPRIVFHGMCCFSLLSSHNLKIHRPYLHVKSDTERFVVPGLPMHNIEILKNQLPGAFMQLPDLDDIRDKMEEAESSAYAVVVNTFTQLENGCAEEYSKAINKKVWCIGPVSLCNKNILDMYQRGNKPSIDEKQCVKWLDTMKNKSVLYCCLGSQCRLIAAQLKEIGLGLEASNWPFIWVIKNGGKLDPELEKWLIDEKYEERIKRRGLVIKGWAPQVLMLSHPAIKGFLTHCGWNSTIESVSCGVPMITWPMFAEQFFNEKLIVEVLRIGVQVGVEIPVRWGEEEKVGVLVHKVQVANAVEKLMDGGEEGEMRRNKAKELGLVARRTMEENGTSRINILNLIQDILNQS
ncbi:PREDICTED: UDP-glycosyltransferase 73D1-like [Nicotiana attenuata]|uniref:Glycosyltransferase n=1 Tax=Nicotiana attenuata TaxID=49451 RepID=A0A2I2MNH8_NICAT|nr:PREDICTED: UDP-glycosyltransferase 73D1-like [Nicotiana attenuata]AQQ16691.1 UDP-glycosyltransferase g28311 [Nicotiana attenuata]OIT33809.1 udp-glycosyltransferase 73d1 [Nicotiana attenuata]